MFFYRAASVALSVAVSTQSYIFSFFLFSYLLITLLFNFVYLLIQTILWSKKKNLTCFKTLLLSVFNISSLVLIHSYLPMLLRFNTDALLPLYFNAFWFNIFIYFFSLLLYGFSWLFKVEADALSSSRKMLFLEILQVPSTSVFWWVFQNFYEHLFL